MAYQRHLNSVSILLSTELLIYGYARSQYKKFIPNRICKILCDYYQEIIDTKILTQIEQFKFRKLLQKEMNQKWINFELLYRASENNFDSFKLHENVVGQTPTICVIQSEFGRFLKKF